MLSSVISAIALAVSLTDAPIISVMGDSLRISDVIDSETLAPEVHAKISDKIIATNTQNLPELLLSRPQIAALVRRRVPGLNPKFDTSNTDKVSVRFSFVTEKLSGKSDPVCLEFAHAVPAGHPITQEDLVKTDCNSSRPVAGMNYTAPTGVLRARNAIRFGAYAGRLSVPTSKYADTDDALVLRVAIGPVSIEKNVRALQPANGADYIFVQDDDGTVMRVPFASNPSKESVNARPN